LPSVIGDTIPNPERAWWDWNSDPGTDAEWFHYFSEFVDGPAAVSARLPFLQKLVHAFLQTILQVALAFKMVCVQSAELNNAALFKMTMPLQSSPNPQHHSS
jgi:hypothetical protein